MAGDMSDGALAPRTITKSALAALLGIPEGDLVTREKAAEEIEVSQGYLANLAKPDADGRGGGPAYYRSTTSPRGGQVWYPWSEVLAFKNHRDSKIRRRYERASGQQDWTVLQDDNERLPVHVVVTMIKEWKESELYRRAQAILHDPHPESGRGQYEEECRLFAAAEKGGRIPALADIMSKGDEAAAQRRAIFQSLDDQTNAVETHLLALAASHGLSISSSHPSFFVLTAMFERAWGDVLEAETRWRNFDYTGMPDYRPQTISDFSISVSLKSAR